MKMEQLFSAEGLQSPSTSDVSKPAAKGNGAKKSTKKRKHVTKKAGAKKAKSRAKGNGAKRKHVAKKKTGRPMMFPDRTLVRMPRGFLKVINAKANAKKVSQGAYLRGVIGRAIGK